MITKAVIYAASEVLVAKFTAMWTREADKATESAKMRMNERIAGKRERNETDIGWG